MARSCFKCIFGAKCLTYVFLPFSHVCFEINNFMNSFYNFNSLKLLFDHLFKLFIHVAWNVCGGNKIRLGVVYGRQKVYSSWKWYIDLLNQWIPEFKKGRVGAFFSRGCVCYSACLFLELRKVEEIRYLEAIALGWIDYSLDKI